MDEKLTTRTPVFEAKQDKKMQGNVDEHAVFTGKLDILESWLGKCLADVSLYDPAEHRRQIAELLPVIMPHLAHELDTLDAQWIKDNFTKPELDDMLKKVEKHVQSKDPFIAVPIVILHTPPKAEIGGESWPHMPWFVRHILGASFLRVRRRSR